MEPTSENLARVRVLYRQPDTLALWGIPYDMRSEVGQQPRDIERAREENNTRLRERTSVYVYPQPKYQDPHEGWIWLGQPGWWGPYAAGVQIVVRNGTAFTYPPARFLVEAFLAGLPAGAVPQGPCEWTNLSDFALCDPT